MENKYIKENISRSNTHFPSPIREWNNSIYVFNKNNLNLIPSTYTSAMSLIKGYFLLFNKKLEKKIRTKRLLFRLRRLSSNRIYISNGEFKHTNNKLLINIYLYNRQKYNYLSKLKTIFLYKIKARNTINVNIIKKLKSINTKGLEKLKQSNKNKYLIINLLNMLNNKSINLKSLSEYTSNYYKTILRISMKRVRMYFLYRQLLLINKNKLNYTYLHLLKKSLEKLFNKNVEFNLINLKRFYLNSDILSEVVKLRLTRNRRKLLKTLNKIKDKIKIHKKPLLLDKFNNVNKLKLRDLRINNPNNFIWNNLKYKHVTGFRLETRGRLTRRFTASRAISKLRYKGNLLNIDSSYRGLSSIILKGNLKSNVQHTKLKSKTKIGSFGLKGWISGN